MQERSSTLAFTLQCTNSWVGIVWMWVEWVESNVICKILQVSAWSLCMVTFWAFSVIHYSLKCCVKYKTVSAAGSLVMRLKDSLGLSLSFVNCVLIAPLWALLLSSWYSSHWCRRWRRHKVWISDNMGGKSSVTFYCSLHGHVMVLLNCAELNGVILWPTLERDTSPPAQHPRAISPSKSRKREHFLWRVLHFSHNYIATQQEKIRRKVIVECSGW